MKCIEKCIVKSKVSVGILSLVIIKHDKQFSDKSYPTFYDLYDSIHPSVDVLLDNYRESAKIIQIKINVMSVNSIATQCIQVCLGQDNFRFINGKTENCHNVVYTITYYLATQFIFYLFISLSSNIVILNTLPLHIDMLIDSTLGAAHFDVS